MSDWKVVAENGSEREVDSRSEAEEVQRDMEHYGLECEIIGPETDGGSAQNAEVVESEPAPTPEPKDESDATTAELEGVETKDISTDPLSVMPSHFVDTIQGVPTINRKGYCVLAEHFGVSVKADPVTLPSETDFEYAEFRAVATTEDGSEYSGFGSAHVDRDDGDDPQLLAELAETRAMKRATAWATGVGITAYSEMSNEL